MTGDTLSGIASRYGVSQASIASANHLPSSNIVRLGATLVIPGGRSAGTSTSANTFAGRTYSSSVVGSAAHNRYLLSRRNLPSQYGMRDIIAAKPAPTGSTRRWRWPSATRSRAGTCTSSRWPTRSARCR